MDIKGLNAFADNYIWLVQQEQQCWVVDPGDADPVLDYIQQQNLELIAILITHKHGDHCGGVAELKAAFPQAVVYKPAHEPVRGDIGLGEGEQILLFDQHWRVMELPGHTEGHLAYYQPENHILFCGDVLFAAGCGRVFSGTFEQMAHSLQRIAALPEQTQIYCAHEYTLANLGFAQWVEPDNPDLKQRIQSEQNKRAQGLPTVPSSLSLELQTNPFLRWNQPIVQEAASRWAGRSLKDPVSIFTALRQWKDRDYD